MIFVSFPYDNTKILLNRKKKKKKKNRLMIIKALSHDDPDYSLNLTEINTTLDLSRKDEDGELTNYGIVLMWKKECAMNLFAAKKALEDVTNILLVADNCPNPSENVPKLSSLGPLWRRVRDASKRLEEASDLISMIEKTTEESFGDDVT
ncbi:hypothetical protein F2Q68_00043550 [Brassica cretica]|uniref:Uncharacterized protein n=1 Tax=Brassica cretica TaxID=69181 RepID=A0A8S9LP88_BRACR|nr:hypothetical protein F2Q68_00043550 [Brassica cretica]